MIDTTHLILMLEDADYKTLFEMIDNKRIEGIISVVSLTEITKVLGKRDLAKARNIRFQIKGSNLIIAPIDTRIAEKAGEIRIDHDIPTIDAIICATGIVRGAKHILTADTHFEATKNLIKPIDLKKAIELGKNGRE